MTSAGTTASADSEVGAVTQDVISDQLRILQHARGYRFGLDALLLATDLPCTFKRVCELGAAQGPVILSILSRHPKAQGLAIELQPSLIALLEQNIALNALDPERVRVLEADVSAPKGVIPPHWADLVVFNPPYFPPNKRDPSELEERAIARHELRATLGDFVRCAQYVLKPRGWLKLIIPPWRLLDLLSASTTLDLAPVSMRMVHASPSQDAYLIEVIMRRSARADLRIDSPLFVRGEDDYYTHEVATRVAGAALASTPPNAQIEQVRLRSLSSHRRPSAPKAEPS